MTPSIRNLHPRENIQLAANLQVNDREQAGISAVHGCVTTGEDWQFLGLEGSAVTVDRSRVYIDNVGLILGAFGANVARSRGSA